MLTEFVNTISYHAVYVITFLASFSLTILVTPIIKKFATATGVVDQPGKRKIHQQPIPLLGGVGIFITLLITAVALYVLGYLDDGRFSLKLLVVAGVAGLILIAGGYLDDRYRLSPIKQILFPIIASIIMVCGGLTIRFVTNPLGGILDIPLIIGGVITFFWLLATIYTTKLLDGVDGLLTGVSAIGSIIIFLVSLHWDVPFSATSFLAIAFAGTLIGFLFFNWHPASIFLGEGGSVLCGFVLGVLSIISGSKIATTLLIMGLPMLDLVLVILQRWWHGVPVTMGDGRHLHFKLLSKGFSQRQTVILLYTITAAFGAVAIISSTTGKLIALTALVGVVLFLSWYAGRTK